MIILAAAHFAWAGAQVKPVDGRISKMKLTATELAHYMAPGVNLGNTMEACDWNDVFTNQAGLKSETSWQNDKTTESYIRSLKQQGFNSLRIPISWVAGHLTDKEKFRKLWTNIAKEFKTYDQRVLFAALNEPGVGGASPQVQGDMLAPDSKEFADRLLAYEQVFIDAVRATSGNNASRVLIVQTPKTEIDLAAKDSYDITRLKDKVKNRLMAEVHFYDPYIFTLMDKDADWGKVALYWKGHAPADDQGRTVNTIWYNNKNVDAYQHITNQVMKMKQKFVDQGYPVVIGEYGANRKDASLFGGNQEKHNESMMAWYGAVTAEMMKAGLIPYVWDINVQPLPHMTIFDRKKQVVSDSYIFKGVMQGAAEGMEDYLKIYPKS